MRTKLIFTLGATAVAAITSSALNGIAFADTLPASQSHLGSHLQQKLASQWNRTHKVSMAKNWAVQRPFSEVEETGFVAISGSSIEQSYELPDLRMAIAQNLPAPVVLVIYVDDPDLVEPLKELYSPYLSPERLQFLLVPAGSDEIWGRDSLPFPVVLQSANSSTPPSYGLVDSIYPQNFEPDAAFATAFSQPMQQTGIQFRGGNLLFDLEGNCFAENVSEVANMNDPTAFFSSYFGCKTTTLLKYSGGGGIGDIDERVKFLNGKDVLTDNEDYAKQFTQAGYQVHMIPSTGIDNETYMNTLLVNGTIFVPQMDIDADAAALQAYQNLGFKTVGVRTKDLADFDLGNIHCLTMNYPRGSFVSNVDKPEFVTFK